MRFSAAGALVALVVVAGPVEAQESTIGLDPGPRLGFHLGAEAFQWDETDPDQPSRKIVEEDGARFNATATFDNFMRVGEGPIYEVKGRGYYGEVDYDGETQAGVPAKSEVDYWGGLVEGRIGYRFPLRWAGVSVDGLGGLGGEFWSRDIKDTFDQNGNPVRGVREEYKVFYGKLGVGLADHHSQEWFGRLEAGVKLPFSVEEDVPTVNADLSPDGDVSFYAQYEISKAIGGGKRLGLTVFYDSYRFDESPLASSSIGLVRQPESDMDILGLRVGLFI